MWLKLLLLTLYIFLVFVLSRILETVSFYDAGYLASRLLDPVSLSVKKLKSVLDQRGVSYNGVVEKAELTDLVEASGDMTESELEVSTTSEEGATSTSFTCGSHFYEEVEDTKDSAWLVQVIPDQSQLLLPNTDWRALTKKLARFGIRTGVFDCSLDWRLCHRKKWYTSRLVMALPQGQKVKDNVIIRNYSGAMKPDSISRWVSGSLASRLREIYDWAEMENDWFSWEGFRRKNEVRFVLFSKLKRPPMFFSALSVKFTGRVKFGTVDVKSREGKNILNKMKFKQVPQYMIITPECKIFYGKRPKELYNFRSVEFFLKTMYPEVNDIFLLSLVIVNVYCLLDLCLVQGGVTRRLCRFFWNLGKQNCILILLWLPVLGLFQLPFMEGATNQGLKFLRLVSGSDFAAVLRSDWAGYLDQWSLLLLSFVAYGVIIAVIEYKRTGGVEPEEEVSTSSHWWDLRWDGYMNYFFRPMVSLTRPMNAEDMDLEAGMELLIERLAVPNFWLHPMISSDYIKELPVWHYAGKSFHSDSDTCSNSDDTRMESDSDGGAEIGHERPTTPDLFVCEHCRASKRPQTEQERLDATDACAAYVMDGNYKCSCKLESNGKVHGETWKPRHGAKEPRRKYDEGDRGTGVEVDEKGCEEDQLPYCPPGILPCTECVICLEGYRYGVVLCGLPCGHSFHQQCIMSWLSRDNHCCPVCRWPTFRAKPCKIHCHSE